MNAFVSFMASAAGRIVRILAGIALIAWGYLSHPSNMVLMAVGALPLLAGLFDICIFAPLFGQSISGAKIRGAK